MASYFDIHAPGYDEVFSNTPVGRLQRSKVQQSLKKILVKDWPLRILEINCGTGTDAFWLANQGHLVVATDASARMIEICQGKLEALKQSEQAKPVQTVSFPEFIASDFRDLEKKFPAHSFDLVFSNFGGLNCIGPGELKELSENLSMLLKPDGRFVAVVMGRKCLWEQLYFSFKKKTEQMHRRKSIRPVEARLKDATQPTWYYSPREFFVQFESEFMFEFQKPIGLFIPPSYLAPFFSNKPLLLKSLNVFENLFAFSAFADYADHFLVAMRKKP